MIDKIQVLLKLEIRNYEKEIKDNYNNQSKHIQDIVDKLSNVIKNPDELSNIDLKKLKENLPFLTDEILRKLELYKALTFSSYDLSEIQKVDITNIFDDIIKRLNSIISSINYDNEEVKSMKIKIDELKLLLYKIDINNNEHLLEFEDISKIIDILNKNNLASNEKIQMISELTLCAIQKIKNSKMEKEEIIEVIETNLPEEEVEKLLSTYSYDYQLLDEDDKELLLKYGNLKKIDGILKVLDENGIKIDLKEYSGQMSAILVHSNYKIVSDIIDNAKKDLQNITTLSNDMSYSLNKTILELLQYPSIFIDSERKYQKGREKGGPGGKGGPSGGGGNNDIIPAAHNNYLLNRQTFIDLGIDIIPAIEKCSSVFPVSNTKIMDSIKKFEFYNIPKEVYCSALSCLKAGEQLSTMDRFIEVDCYDYMMENFSSIYFRNPDDEIFYKIIKAKQDNISIYREFINKNITKKQFDRKKLDSIKLTDSNRSETINQYFIEKNPKIDSILDSNENSGPLDLVNNNQFIKMIEQYREEDYKYNFNGVIISRMKVLRLYETLLKNGSIDVNNPDSIKYVICKNSILTEEQYRKIEDCLDVAFKSLKGVSR